MIQKIFSSAANFLYKILTDSTAPTLPDDKPDNNMYELEAWQIEHAIKEGATIFEISEQVTPIHLKTLERLKQAVENNLISASLFLRQVVISYKYSKNYGLDKNTQNKLYYDLIVFSISKKADVNTILVGTNAILHAVDNLKAYKLLVSHGAKCGTLAEQLKMLMQAANIDKQDIADFPKKLKQAIGTEEAPYSKIPFYVNHIWLTSEITPQEINDNDLKNVAKTKEFFITNMRYNGLYVNDWHHIVWVNNKNITKSINYLNDHDIEVRSIFDYQDNLRLFDNVLNLIQNKNFLMASDVLRYSIIEHFGGIYADLNYEFLYPFNNQLNKYDFMSNSLINNFFAAKAFHPIITNEINLLDDTFNNPSSDLSWLNKITDPGRQTILTTAITFANSIIKYSNDEGYNDFVYPSFGILTFEEFYCDKIISNVWSYPNLLDICPNPALIGGIDHHNTDYSYVS